MTSVDRVTALWSAFAAGGPLATLDHLHEDCEWVPSPDLPAASAIHGADAIRGLLERMRSDGVRIEPTLHSCEAIGDRVVVCGRMRIVSRAALSDSPLFWVYRLRDERVVRVEAYPCRRDALAATAVPA
jgi:ketosteroid isomerase-like protein